jgi:hypothetical protein
MEQTPTVKLLLAILEQQQEIINQQAREIEILKEEVKRLKKHKGKPRIKPSQMNNDKSTNADSSNPKKRAGSEKRNKNAELTIHEEKIISAEHIPAGARFKGYQDYVVQDLVISAKNTRYRLERWQFPDGSYHVATLPADITGYHFGPTLRSFIDYQYHHQHVTQPLLWAQLRDYGVDISTGELNHLLTETKEVFHQEKIDILPAGLAVSSYIHVDDTGARHKGKNGYCTHIGNELFAWFESTGSKSRINFLELLQMGNQEYVLNAEAFDYMKRHKLPSDPLGLLKQADSKEFITIGAWEKHLDFLEIKTSRHRQIATEGALVGSILSKGFFVDITIMSDDAGQFNIFQHILCWIHAERKINELVPLHDAHAKDIEHIRSLFWAIYALLKEYKLTPNKMLKADIDKKFDAMCATKTSYQLLNNVLKRLSKNKSELLLVLIHPYLPLHNNLSEGDIREYVKKRKISGSTRSDSGQRCRDTLTSLKKTCRKLKVNFWDYLLDRHSKKFKIPQISDLINLAAGVI